MEDKSNTTSGGLYRAAVKDGSGTVVAYLVESHPDQMPDGCALLVLSESPNYLVLVNPFTGQYCSYNLGFSGSNCTGDATITQDGGVFVGQTTVYNSTLGKYYKASSQTSSSVASVMFNGSCSNASNSGTYHVVSEIAQPYDFTAIAPLSISVD